MQNHATEAATRQAFSALAQEVESGLLRTPKSLSPWLFYDAEGSQLFEQITELPEYYLTRVERGILSAYAEEIVQQAGSNLTLIELGAGTATKTSILIDALLRRQLRLYFYPIDVSSTALDMARQRLETEFPRLTVRPIAADYTEGFHNLRTIPRRKLVLYLGSSVGNFEPQDSSALLHNLRSQLCPGDCLLMGADIEKSADILVPAYDDAAGVTAQFNRNILVRINRELDATFDIEKFRHVARWNSGQSRMELYLESTVEQKVRIAALDLELSFEKGERIHTENSYKYSSSKLETMFADAGFRLERTWMDPQRWFALSLARVPLPHS